VLDNLPSFDGGGLVNAPIGQGVLALVHGGETIRTPEQEATVGRSVNLTMNNDNRGVTDPGAMSSMLSRELGWELAALG